MCSGSNPEKKEKEGEELPVCYKTQGSMSRTLERALAREKAQQVRMTLCLGTTVLDLLLLSNQVRVRLFSDSMGCSPSGSSVWDFPGKSTGVGGHFLLQGIFLTQDRTHVSCITGGFFTTEPPGKPCLRLEPLKISMMPLSGSGTCFISCRCNEVNM